MCCCSWWNLSPLLSDSFNLNSLMTERTGESGHHKRLDGRATASPLAGRKAGILCFSGEFLPFEVQVLPRGTNLWDGRQFRRSCSCSSFRQARQGKTNHRTVQFPSASIGFVLCSRTQIVCLGRLFGLWWCSSGSRCVGTSHCHYQADIAQISNANCPRFGPNSPLLCRRNDL